LQDYILKANVVVLVVLNIYYSRFEVLVSYFVFFDQLLN